MAEPLTIAAMLVLIVGLFVLFLAWLSAHDTAMPQLRAAGLVWGLGLGLVGLAVVLIFSPNLFAYGACETSCDVLDGKTQPQTANNAHVESDFESCLVGARAQVRRDAELRAEEDASVNPAIEVADAEEDIQDLCRRMVLSVCVSECYNGPDESD